MPDSPRISVVIPVFNVDKYLRECLDSVVNQTLRDIEIICVNDGSTDGSLGILEEYAKRDERIVVIDQPNQGVGRSRNKAIDSAHGEFVIFMDPDDWYPSSDILYSLYYGAKEHKVKICGGSFSHSYGSVVQTEYTGTSSGYTFHQDGLVEYADYQFDYGFHRFIYDLAMLKENHVYFPEYARFQDPPFFVRAMLQAAEFYALEKISYRYRSGTQTIRWSPRKANDLVRGIIDNLSISKSLRLSRLHYLTLDRANQFKGPISMNTKSDNPEMAYLLAKANSLIDAELIRREDPSFPDNYLLEPLAQALFPPGILARLRDIAAYPPRNALAFFRTVRKYGMKHAIKAADREMKRVLLTTKRLRFLTGTK